MGSHHKLIEHKNMTSQPNPTRTNEQTFYVKPDGANINVPVPIPASLGCAAPECKNIFGRGPWRGVVDRHRKLTEHFDKFHGRGTKHTMTFTCCNCRADIGSNLLSANKHASSGSSPPPSLPAFNPPPHPPRALSRRKGQQRRQHRRPSSNGYQMAVRG